MSIDDHFTTPTQIKFIVDKLHPYITCIVTRASRSELLSSQPNEDRAVGQRECGVGSLG